MIKALINVMGLRPGDTVLDPMMGSGTVLIEAKLMGIKSVGTDVSPFCRFMTRAKLDGLTMPLKPVNVACEHSQMVFEHFKNRAGQPVAGSKVRYVTQPYSFPDGLHEDAHGFAYDSAFGPLPDGCE